MLRKLILSTVLSLVTLATAAPAQAQSIYPGLLVSSNAGNTEPSLQNKLREQIARIPLRCLSLVESDEAAYRTCRAATMQQLLWLEATKSGKTISECQGLERIESNPKANELYRKGQTSSYAPMIDQSDIDWYKKYQPMCDVNQHITWEISTLKALAAQAAAKPAN